MKESDKVLAQSDNDVQENIQVEIDENTIQEFMRKSYWNEEYLFYQVDKYSRKFKENHIVLFVITTIVTMLVFICANLKPIEEIGSSLWFFHGWLFLGFMLLFSFMMASITIHVATVFENFTKKEKDNHWEIFKGYWIQVLYMDMIFMFSLLWYPIMFVVSYFASGWYQKAITDLNANKIQLYRWLFNLTKQWITSKMHDEFYRQFNYSTEEHMAKTICLYMSLRKHDKHHLTERQMLNHWRELSKQLRRSTSKIEDPKIWLDLTPVLNMKEEVVSSNTVISLHNANNHFMGNGRLSLQHVPIPLQY